MKSVVMRDLRDYVRKYWGLLAASMAAMLICFGYLVFCGNIRIDTEELINHPGSSLGWLAIGRWELAWLKHLLGLGTHQVIKSGILFFLFFWLGANLLTFGIYERSGKKKSRYWIFLLLYVTSNIWCYQIYFSLQQAEVALAMLLLIEAAFLDERDRRRNRNESAPGFCGGRSVIYRSGIVSGAGGLLHRSGPRFLPGGADCGAGAGRISPADSLDDRTFRCGVSVLSLVYEHVSGVFGLYGQPDGLGKTACARMYQECAAHAEKSAARPWPQKFFVLRMRRGASACAGGKCACLPEKTGTSVGEEENPVFIAWTGGTGACAAASDGIHGRVIVTRSQFALPVAGAFLGMYVTERLAELWNGRDRGTGYWLLLVCRLCICLVIAVQTGYDLRLAVTDEIRCREDEQKTQQLLERLAGADGGTAAASGGVCGLSGSRSPEVVQADRDVWLVVLRLGLQYGEPDRSDTPYLRFCTGLYRERAAGGCDGRAEETRGGTGGTDEGFPGKGIGSCDGGLCCGTAVGG